MKKGLPIVTLLILAVSSLSYLSPFAAGMFIYDRELILHGQLWRLLTCVFVHFSADHFFYNALVVGAAGWLIERNQRLAVGIQGAIAAVSGSLFLLLARREVGFYGGLSGLAVMMVVYLGLGEAKSGGPAALWWRALLAGVVIKIIFEVMTGSYVFVVAEAEKFVVLPSMHLIGGLTALVSFIMRQTILEGGNHEVRHI